MAVGCALLAGCGALGPLFGDAGADAGSAPLSWVDVPLDVEPGAKGSVTGFAQSSSAVYATVAERWVLVSTGGRFTVSLELGAPAAFALAASDTGDLGVAVASNWFFCPLDCSDTPWDWVPVGRAVRAGCSGPRGTGLVVPASDGSAVAFDVRLDGGWVEQGQLSLSSVSACARTDEGALFVGGRGAIARALDGGVQLDVPDVTALSRVSSDELWQAMTTDGAEVIAGSARGAVALGSVGAWTVESVADEPVLSVTKVGGLTFAFTRTGGVLRRDATGWQTLGAAPAGLASIDAFIATPQAFYVGGQDSSGSAHIFRAAR